jgi:hypothetical protein
MPTVRISGNPRSLQNMEWLGAPAIDEQGHIERTLEIPEKAYQEIEKAIAGGHIEGIVYLGGGIRFNWFLDHPRPKYPLPKKESAP